MTEKEKALGYIQMLKNEGKLDENALHELTDMYGISHEEARELLGNFKQTEAYEKGAAKNITYYVLLTLFTAGAAAVFGFMAFSHGGSTAFATHFYIMLLSALGASTYLSKLVAERYRLGERYKWLQNKALPAVVFTLPFFLFSQYRLSQKTFLAHPGNWVQLPSMALAADCREESTGGKNPSHYYTLYFGYYLNAFEYHSSEHQYCLTHVPDRQLKKGDTITLWVEKNEKPELQMSSDNKVWDIGYRGERWLNIKCRNYKTQQSAENTRNLVAVMSGASLAAFLFFQRQLSKRPVT